MNQHRKRLHVVICGYYGKGNLGDEIILETMLRSMRAAFPETTFVVFSDNPRQTSQSFGVASVMKRGSWFDWLRRIRVLISADLFILGGGGILMDYGASAAVLLKGLEPLDVAQLLGVPTMTYGIGVGDVYTGKGQDALRTRLNETSVVCVRDRDSQVRLAELGVQKCVVTGDPGVTISDQFGIGYGQRALHVSSPQVSVFLRHWFVNKDETTDIRTWERFEDNLAEFLDILVETRAASVVFAPMRTVSSRDDDRVVAKEVVDRMTQKKAATILEGEPSTSKLMELVSQSDLVVGMRLHSVISAASVGTPTIAVSYASKVESFMQSIGAAEWVLRPDQCSVETLQGLSEKVFAGNYPRETLRVGLEKLKESERQNVAHAADLLLRAEGRRRRLSKAMAGLGIATGVKRRRTNQNGT
ncbi:MAG: polysaccharide pyruvyl transferase family protein [Thaumarchaeota archaeon]|nr:polysaccharide pyruvyl transferase family protein [Nitrososphaerota archaeon]